MTTQSLPFISVIVPAFNRPDSLKALLAALEEQSYPPYRFEVLVCDDGSTPPLSEQVPVKELPFPVRFLRDVNQGPAAARNRGIQEARGSVVAFTDDDCEPADSWLESIASAMRDPAVYAVHGPTRSSVPPIEPFIHSIHIDQSHGVATANFAVRKEALTAVGGFDETFRVPYFEDEDLSRRLQLMHGPVTWNEGAHVVHPPRPKPFSSVWRGAGFYYYLSYMQRKYPGYWRGAMFGVIKRVAVKSILIAVGVAPLFGAPASFAVVWGLIAAWQLKRLQRTLRQAADHQVAVPIADQVAFVGLEWLVDFARLGAYMRGLRLRQKPENLNLEELMG